MRVSFCYCPLYPCGDETPGNFIDTPNGAALLCPESYELINTVKLAMDLGADFQQLRDAVYTHPTMTETFNVLFAV